MQLLYRKCLAGAQIIFPENGRDLGHVTLQFLVYDRTYLQKLLELETSNLVHGFVLGMPSRRTNNFPESGRGLSHVTPTIFGSTVGYPSDSLASCCILSVVCLLLKAASYDGEILHADAYRPRAGHVLGFMSIGVVVTKIMTAAVTPGRSVRL